MHWKKFKIDPLKPPGTDERNDVKQTISTVTHLANLGVAREIQVEKSLGGSG